MKTIYKTSNEATQLAALHYLAESLGLNPKYRRLEGFAEACFNDNSNDELIEALQSRAADKTDCENWNITPTVWRDSIREALEYRIFLAIEDITAD